MHLQFFEFNPQHGRAFLAHGFVLVAFEGGGRPLLCSEASSILLLFHSFISSSHLLRAHIEESILFVLSGVL